MAELHVTDHCYLGYLNAVDKHTDDLLEEVSQQYLLKHRTSKISYNSKYNIVYAKKYMNELWQIRIMAALSK